MTRRLSHFAIAALLLGGALTAHAALVKETGQRMGSTTAPNLADPLAGGDTDAASNAFRAWDKFVVITGTESFSGIAENEPSDQFAPDLTLGGGTGSMTCGDGLNPPFCKVQLGAEAGRYDTTGAGANGPAHFLHVTASPLTVGNLEWNLTGVQAFSFMATDVGDFGGSFSIDVTRSNGSSTVTQNYVLASGSGSGGGSDSSSIISPTGPNGNLIFFGLYNDGKNGDDGFLFTKVVFKNVSPGDGFAVDDLRVGRFDPTATGGGGGTTPEPAGLALALAALGAAGLARRRRA